MENLLKLESDIKVLNEKYGLNIDIKEQMKRYINKNIKNMCFKFLGNYFSLEKIIKSLVMLYDINIYNLDDKTIDKLKEILVSESVLCEMGIDEAVIFSAIIQNIDIKDYICNLYNIGNNKENNNKQVKELTEDEIENILSKPNNKSVLEINDALKSNDESTLKDVDNDFDEFIKEHSGNKDDNHIKMNPAKWSNI